MGVGRHRRVIAPSADPNVSALHGDFDFTACSLKDDFDAVVTGPISPAGVTADRDKAAVVLKA